MSSTDEPAQRPARIAILATAKTSASVVYGLYDMFLAAGREWGLVVDGRPGRPLIDATIVGTTAGPLTVSNGAMIAVHADFASARGFDVVCVPEIAIAPSESTAGRFVDEVRFLARCHDEGATIATACSGAVLLAETGLLDGFEATTHWAYCDALQARFPSITVRPRRALVVSGEGQRLVMAGGGTSYLDLGLFLVARVAGVDAAMQVARLNLLDWHDVGQQPFARLASTRQVDDAAIGRCQAWIAENYAVHAPVAEMARLVAMPERSFKRRFELATGLSPLAYVQAVRLEEAKQMLETTTMSLDAIAREVGYEDPAFFSRLFRREVALTPAQYRKRFASMRARLGETSKGR